MSYAWQIAGDAIADLRDLPPWLQEEVLDEFERVSANPLLLRAGATGNAIHDFERRGPDVSHVVFLKLNRDDARRVVTVLGIAHHPRPRA